MNNEYKYWLYYLKTDDQYSLYAYTDKKDIAAKFEDFRDMSLFKKKKVKLTRKEVNDLAYNYQYNYLEIYKMDVVDKKRLTSFVMDIAITISERSVMTNTIFNIQSGMILTKDTWTDYKIFNNEIRKALDYIYYSNLCKYIKSGKFYPICDVIPDELGIFIHYFGKTMKGDSL